MGDATDGECQAQGRAAAALAGSRGQALYRDPERHQEIRRFRRGRRCLPERLSAASSSRCWAARAAARPRCCACWPASRLRPPGGSSSTASTWPTSRPIERPDQHDVPVLCAVPAYDGGAERRLRPEAGRHAARRRSPSGSMTCSTWSSCHGFAQAQAPSALGRPAPAGGARPQPGQAAQAAAARRAAGRARQEAARGDAVRAHEHPGQARRHLHGRHPRPGGGDDAVDPHRGHERRAGSSRSARRRRSTSFPTAASSPISSARSTSSKAS